MSQCMQSRASPFRCFSVIVLRKQLLRYLRRLTERSHSALVTASVQAILNNISMFGKKSLSITAKTLAGVHKDADSSQPCHLTLQQCSSVSREAGAGKSSPYNLIKSAIFEDVRISLLLASVEGSHPLPLPILFSVQLPGECCSWTVCRVRMVPLANKSSCNVR